MTGYALEVSSVVMVVAASILDGENVGRNKKAREMGGKNVVKNCTT